MDSQRQKKVSTLIKKDIAKIIDSVLRNRAFRGVLVSVTNVKTCLLYTSDAADE